MFITKHDGQLYIVNQYDHSVQAGEVARRWGNETFARPDHFESLCLAVQKHDIGWVESDEKVLFNEQTGQPVPFLSVNLLQHVDFYGKGYEQVKDEDLYAGLLVGMHWIGLYTSRFGYDPSFTFNIPQELASFIDENITKTQKDWVEMKMQLWNRKERRSLFEDHLWMNYEIVQLMDRLSQYVSMHQADTKNEWVLGPVRQTVDSEGCMITIQGQGDGTVVVDPFPFDDVVETTVLARKIPDIQYGNHKEVYDAMEAAPVEKVVWKFIPKQV
ncbi:DUF3891 family protein [Paenibacillus beijingensis]|uniref:DUF3891 domain-containing protein n=1 Tax=Paenibacillus beijingensis TaxID=1126833 RepID=A0A0D5NLN6_9BACL|nr:DUF3891 family protein [Paenibacillus beijingensis]AJY76156.1 hypothetical protein VN24_18330 [Paenibacillus beijingensis]